MNELELYQVWPEWEISHLIGQGSFGAVYEIVRKKFGIEEHCALKVISIPSSPAELQGLYNEGMDDVSVTEYYKGLVDEFVQEIALMAKLKGHMNIVSYEDFEVIKHKDGIGWDILIRMELLTAFPNYLKEHSFTANDVIALTEDMCRALSVCHAQNIIHRDIKPDNIFVSKNGDYKLGDFGVARTIEKAGSGLSKKGTYSFMAPEVYKGEVYGLNADIYSLGVVMYMLVNDNRGPFMPPYPDVVKFVDKNQALEKRMCGETIKAPLHCDAALSRIILKAVSYRAQDRYQSATELMEALSKVRSQIKDGDVPVLFPNQVAPRKTTPLITGNEAEIPSEQLHTKVEICKASEVKTDIQPTNESIGSVELIGPASKLSFGKAIGEYFKKYADFKGVTSREGFWWPFLLRALITIPLCFVWPLAVLWILSTFLPNLAAGVRRIHDTGKKGTQILYGLIPFAGPIILWVKFSKPGIAYEAQKTELLSAPEEKIQIAEFAAEPAQVPAKETECLIRGVALDEQIQNHEPREPYSPETKTVFSRAISQILPGLAAIENISLQTIKDAFLLTNEQTIRSSVKDMDSNSLIVAYKAFLFYSNQAKEGTVGVFGTGLSVDTALQIIYSELQGRIN